MPFRKRRLERYAETLGHTAQMEISLGMDSWQDTLSQMYAVIDRIDQQRKEHRSAEDTLIDQLRHHVAHLEASIHRREGEYDRLQERYCRMQEDLTRIKAELED